MTSKQVRSLDHDTTNGTLTCFEDITWGASNFTGKLVPSSEANDARGTRVWGFVKLTKYCKKIESVIWIYTKGLVLVSLRYPAGEHYGTHFFCQLGEYYGRIHTPETEFVTPRTLIRIITAWKCWISAEGLKMDSSHTLQGFRHKGCVCVRERERESFAS